MRPTCEHSSVPPQCVDRSRSDREGDRAQRHPRRPRQLYRAQNPLGSGFGITSGYEKLAHVLAAHFARHADGDPEQLAEAAGRQWALDDLGQTSGNGRSAEDAAVVVTTLFAEMGFDPELESSTSRTRIRLHACPFESVARENPSVVCSLHLGLIRGVLTRLGARQIKSTLTPWDTAHTCLAQLERQ